MVYVGSASIHSFPARNENVLQLLSASRCSFAASFRGHLARRQQIGVVVSIVLFIAVSQRHFAEQH